MGYHIRCFMAFSPNDQCYGQNDDMVCDNVPILCTHVHLGMMNNVAVGSFPFRRTEKQFSIFLVPKTRCFVKQPPNKSFKPVPPHFSKIVDQLPWTISYPGYLKPFRPLLMKKTNFCRISRKSVRFELQVHDLLLMIFWKNHFQFHNMIFHQRSTASLARLVPELRIFMPAVLTIIETGIRNSKTVETM